MPLNAPAISEAAVNYAAKRLVAEWLTGYFDGNPHLIGANPGVTFVFPLALIAFDQGPVSAQPLRGVEIRGVLMPGRGTRNWEAGGPTAGQRARRRATFNFWVRANVPTNGEINSKQQAELVGDLLVAILENPVSRLPLAQKGVGHLYASAPEPIQSTDYATVLVSCRAMLEYIVAS